LNTSNGLSVGLVSVIRRRMLNITGDLLTIRHASLPVGAFAGSFGITPPLGSIQLGHDVWIAAKRGAERREIVDKAALVARKRVQLESLTLDTRTALQIDESV